MCEISTIAEDWIIKGVHLHVDAIEVTVHPNHLGALVFGKVFSTTTDAELKQAIKRIELHLGDIENRRRLHREIERARAFITQNTTALQELANGRAAEFTFLMHALKNMGI